MDILKPTMLALALSFASPAHAAELAQADRQFLAAAAHAGRFEIEASQMAVQRAGTDEIRAFAKKMITDHTHAEAELKALASKRGVSLPNDPDGKQKATLTALGKKTGRDYDRDYVDEVGVAAHGEAVRLFETAAAKAQDAEVKAWAGKTLPVLRHHQEAAQALARRVAAGDDRKPPPASQGDAVPMPSFPGAAGAPRGDPAGKDRGTVVPAR